MSASSWRRMRSLLMALGVFACGSATPAPSAEARPLSGPPSAGRANARRPIDARTVDGVRLAWEAAVGGFGRGAAVHARLGKVFVATDKVTSAYDAVSGERVADLSPCGEVLRGGLAVDGDRLVVACERGLSRFDVASLERIETVEPAPAAATAAAFAPGVVALGHHDGVVRIYTLETGALREVPVPGPPIDVKSLALSPDASIVAVAWIQGSVWWWRVAEPTTPHRLVRHEHESDALAFNRDGSLLAEEGEREHTSLWRLDDGDSPTHRIKNGDWVKRIHFTPDDAWLVRGGSDGLELAEIAGPKRVALDTTGMVEDVALADGATSLAAIDRKGRLTYWAPR